MAGRRFLRGPDGKFRGSLPLAKAPTSGRGTTATKTERPAESVGVHDIHNAFKTHVSQIEALTGEAPKQPTPKPIKKRLSTQDHYMQDALERYAVWQLQHLAEEQAVARDTQAAKLYEEFVEYLEGTGLSLDDLDAHSRGTVYKTAVDDTMPYFLNRLVHHYPGATFSFRFTGLETITEGGKGDIEVIVQSPDFRQPKKISVSLKNYESGPRRIQVGSGTFQSFALRFILPKAPGGAYRNPVDGTTANPRSKDFQQWRDKALQDTGYGHLIAEFRKLDKLHTNMREVLLGDEFKVADRDRLAQMRESVGTQGSKIITGILEHIPQEDLRKEMLNRMGLDGKSEILAIGDGKIADSINDKKFRKTLSRIRKAHVAVKASNQTIAVSFIDEDEAVLTVDVPCTININGGWNFEGEPYRGKRWHPKEKTKLAYGERRPKKSREVATSINAYADLVKIDAVRDIPRAAGDS